jgi:HlyD family secretion protein
MKKRIAIIVSILLVAAGGVWFANQPGKGAVKATGKQGYEFTTIKRGDIENVVSSTGTLAAMSEVSVLAEMSGRVENVYAKNNENVTKGMVLATLNTDMLKINKLSAEASVQKAQANYDLQLLDWQNKTKLSEKGLISDYDYQTSKANLKVCEADLNSAKAALQIINTELDQYAVIKSPIDGIVLNRNIEKGQSVVEGASTNSTTLFTLAEDLSKMEIKAEVDELDISSIKVGQDVNFTVESNPNTTFTGTVNEIRLVPETTDNVVNYYVIIDTLNKDGKLLPGMTADINFIIEKKSDTLLVPRAALRFQPTGLSAAEIAKAVFVAGLAGLPADQQQKAIADYDANLKNAKPGATQTKANATGLAGLMMGGRQGGAGGPPGGGPGGPGGPGIPGASTKKAQAPTAEVKEKKQLWYLNDSGQLAVLLVDTGVSNGLSTEILGGPDLDGRKIILKTKAE